jgi:hypothetical protein
MIRVPWVELQEFRNLSLGGVSKVELRGMNNRYGTRKLSGRISTANAFSSASLLFQVPQLDKTIFIGTQECHTLLL